MCPHLYHLKNLLLYHVALFISNLNNFSQMNSLTFLKSDTVPFQTIFPFDNIAILSAIVIALFISCVIVILDALTSANDLRIKLLMTLLFIGSRPDVGSSKKSSADS